MTDDGGNTTLEHPVFPLHRDPEASFVLVAVEGPDAGRSFVIDGSHPSAVLIGKSPACEVRLSEPSVSRRHASVELVGARLRILDLDSRNGTVVDGVAIVEAYLRGDEVVRIGATALRVERRGPVLAPARSPAMAMTRFGRLIGGSPEMQRLYPLCERLAASDVPLVIEGETGTGKEVLAESIHANSPRAAGPFVVFDCTAVPANLVESELFGHERGAFTGAVSTRRGVFEQAHGGTLLIDEIGDLEPSLQPKLLRAIERCEVRRVGSERWIATDVRLLAATRRDLDREVQNGRFRDDLYHRIAVARIELPALRHRRGDVALLANHFCRDLGGDPHAIAPHILAKWDEYGWPGNVRELRNAVVRRLALGDLEGMHARDSGASDVVGAEVALDGSAGWADQILGLDMPLVAARQKLITEFERRYVERLVAKHGGSVSKAAAASGVALRHFQRLRARMR